MNKEKTSQPVGILNSDYFKNNFSLSHYYPKPHLQDVIEHYWLISWNMPDGQHHRQDVIPHPNTHITFLKNDSHIQGIHLAKYSHTLQGCGSIVGIKFKPAGFYYFADKARLALADVCNEKLDINAVFDIDVPAAEQHILNLAEPLEKIDYLDQLLFSDLTISDKNIARVNKMVAEIADNKNIMKVCDICEKFDINQRNLQRLLSKYIGISAKWIIKRYRMHDALTSIDENTNIDWATLAIDLGYYDQAHFIKDFKKLIGKTPKNYSATITD